MLSEINLRIVKKKTNVLGPKQIETWERNNFLNFLRSNTQKIEPSKKIDLEKIAETIMLCVEIVASKKKNQL